MSGNIFSMSVTFATSCYEKDWKPILLDSEYLPVLQIQNQCHSFAEKILIINNVSDLAAVKKGAERHLQNGTLTRIVIADESMLAPFELTRSDFSNEWVYYNALAPLSAIHEAKSDYLLYLTGDVRLPKPVRWIDRAIARMEKEARYKVANLTWNGNYAEAKKESSKREWYFYVADRGFSDQMFLVRTADFRQPIYKETHPDSHHYPRGDVFERRIFSAMLYRQWCRLTYRFGSYLHQNF